MNRTTVVPYWKKTWEFHTNNSACLKGCYDQMLRTGQAMLIEIHVFCHDLKGHHLYFLEDCLCTMVRPVCGLRGAEKIVMI